MTAAQQLAAFAAGVDRVPAPARRSAVRAVQDLVGSAIAGAATPGGRAVRQAALASWGSGPARVWFSDARLTVPGAAFVNAAYGSMLDLDDGHRAAAGHPGAAIVPAALATAQAIGADADRLLTAIALGFEIGVRIAASRDINQLRTTDTGQWCGYGVAVAAGWLRGLPPGTIAHAMAIAGHTASSQAATGWTRVGHNVKEGIPWATATGLTAVDLAVAGYTGPVDILDDPAVYDQGALLSDLGGAWRIEGAYHKLYSCCRWAHAPIDAVLALKDDNHIPIHTIETIDVTTFSRALTLNNEPAPASLEAAQYSIPFCVALALVRGAEALLPMDEGHLGDPAVVSLARRVRLTVEPSFDALFPAAAPGRVSITFGSCAATRTVMVPKGEPANPLSSEELDAKFDFLAAPQMATAAARRLKTTLHSLHDASDLAPLIGALGLLVDEAGQRLAPRRHELTAADE